MLSIIVKTLSAFLLSIWLASTGSAAAGDVAGVWVNKKSPSRQTEFLPTGEYYYGCPTDFSAGKYTKEKDTLVCSREDEEPMRFRRENEALTGDDGEEWVRRESLVRMPWKDVSPVTMAVLDSKTHKPITRFFYSYRISAPDGEYEPLLVRPQEAVSAEGEFTLSAPKSCEIEMVVSGVNLLGGYGSWRKYNLTSDNMLRRIEAPVPTGCTVTGTVVDARNGKPIAGALVSPFIFRPPLFTPDRSRAVKTDAAGKFEIEGVDATDGINVWHQEYLESGAHFEDISDKAAKPIAKKQYSTEIRLESGERFIGTVKDAAGKPLAGAKVSDGAGKDVHTNKDGGFVLASPRKWGNDETYNLTFEKAGYLNQDFHPKAADPKGFSIVLKPVPQITGVVVDPQGRPVKDYFVVAGVGTEPSSWCCTGKDVRDAKGRFSLLVRTDYDHGETGKVWVGVYGDDFAAWDTVVDISDLARPITARLSPGGTVRGSIVRAKGGTDGISAALLPVRTREDHSDEASYRQELGRMKAAVDARGKFQLEHVGRGQYVLAISGPAISPMSTTIAVAGSGIDAGSFSPRGRGSVEGVIYQAKMICEGDKCRLDEKRGPWAFAEGHATFEDSAGRSNEHEFEHLKPIPFKADENGRFHVDGVPVGNVSVEIPYNATADIVGAHVRKARVLEGKTAGVRFFDPSEK